MNRNICQYHWVFRGSFKNRVAPMGDLDPPPAWFSVEILIKMAADRLLLGKNMGLSENVVYPIYPMVLLIIIPFLNGYFIGGIPHFQTSPHGGATDVRVAKGASQSHCWAMATVSCWPKTTSIDGLWVFRIYLPSWRQFERSKKSEILTTFIWVSTIFSHDSGVFQALRFHCIPQAHSFYLFLLLGCTQNWHSLTILTTLWWTNIAMENGHL